MMKIILFAILIACIVFLVYFCISIIRYKCIQIQIADIILSDEEEDEDKDEQHSEKDDENNNTQYEGEQIPLHNWINADDDDDDDMKIKNKKSSIPIIKRDCSHLVLKLDTNEEHINNVDICQQISKNICPPHTSLEQLRVPIDSNIDIYSSEGIKLVPGNTYCINRSNNNNNNNNNQDIVVDTGDNKPVQEKNREDREREGNSTLCDSVWGYWYHNVDSNKWTCRSKVPGIYDAETNEFNACKPHGVLTYEDVVIENAHIPKKFSPRDFYSPLTQSKFNCKCSNGYVSYPSMSRTTCFQDPCLAGLPMYADAPGYRPYDNTCDCGKHFVNLNNDVTQPCTACPNFPSWDSDTNTLSIFIPCNSNSNRNQDDEDDDSYSYSYIPCITQEDHTRGCVEAYVKVKPITENSNMPFEDRIFF